MRFLRLRHCPKICVQPLLFFVLFSSSSTSLLITIKTYYQTLVYTPLYIMGVLLLSCLLCNFQSTHSIITPLISCRLSATPSDASAGGTVGPIVQSTAAFPASRHPLTVSVHLFSLSTIQRLNIKCRAPHTGAEQSGNSIDDQQRDLTFNNRFSHFPSDVLVLCIIRNRRIVQYRLCAILGSHHISVGDAPAAQPS